MQANFNTKTGGEGVMVRQTTNYILKNPNQDQANY